MRITHGLHPFTTQASAVTVGNFDGVHLGHQAMLQRVVDLARTHHLCATVVTFDPHPREWFMPDKAPARLSSLRDKLSMLARCGIEHVHVCPFHTALAQMPASIFVEDILVRGMNMRYLIIGDDFRFGAQRAGDFALLQKLSLQHAYRLEAMPSLIVNHVRVSSTAVRDALMAANFNLAARLLGRPYCISGHVVHGDKRGRQLGFPTANLQLKSKNVPLSGVFLVRVHGIADQSLPAVANLGTRPTLNAGLQTRLEVHLLHFMGDLYGRLLEVEFLSRIRDEQKFPDLDALTQQINDDVRDARQHFNLPT
jgi:riboflavin kinase/FMN adenylyltransferase